MIKQGSKLLLDEYPLIVLPQLATKIGLNESIILQQVNYWLIQCSKEKDGRLWIYNTYDDWKKQFPFLSLSTIRRTIKKLEQIGLLITGNYNKLKIDQTKWYTIDFDLLNSRYVQCEHAYNSPTVQNEQMDCSKWTDQQLRLSIPLPDTTSKINSKNIIKDKAILQAKTGYNFVDNFSNNSRLIFDYFIHSYSIYKKEAHPTINKKVVDKLNSIMDSEEIYDPDNDKELTIDLDSLYSMIDLYFNTEYQLDNGGQADHRIYHFLSDMILKNLYYKAVY
jgi:hypothetical protein